MRMRILQKLESPASKKETAMRSSSWLYIVGCMLVCLLVAMPGCEKGPNTDELSSHDFLAPDEWDLFNRTSLSDLKLVVTPATAALSYNGALLSLEAIGGTAPFSWSVSDISLGTIAETSGRSAVYRRNAAGDNTVIVRDRNGKASYCIISQ